MAFGTPHTGRRQEVSGDFEPSTGQVIEYSSSGFAWVWESPGDIEEDIVNKIREEQHEPIYVSVHTTGNYLIGYTYNTRVQMRVLHSSPIAISTIVFAVIVLLILIVLYFTAERFYVFLKEEPILGGGLILGLVLLGLVAVGARVPKEERREV